MIFLFELYLTKPNSTGTRRQNVPVNSNVRAVSLRPAARGIVRPTFLLIRGRRSRRNSAVVDLVEVAHVMMVFVLLYLPNETQFYEYS